MDYKFDYSPVIAAIPELLRGCIGTLWLALAGMFLSMIIALAGVMARRSHSKAAQSITIAFVELIRNTPFLVQIYFVFFALPARVSSVKPTMAASDVPLSSCTRKPTVAGSEIFSACGKTMWRMRTQ